MQLDQQTILELCRLRDPLGVLSIYVGATPDRKAKAQPAWAVSIRHELARLRERVRDERGREVWSALSRRLDEVSADLDRLCDPKEHGRGRAMFVPLSGGSCLRIHLQLPLPDRVVLEETPYVRPLVAALDEGRPAGVVGIDRQQARVYEWRLGACEEVQAFSFTEEEEWEKGPPPGVRHASTRGASYRDDFERRLDENRSRWLRSVAERVAKLAAERPWDRVVVLSDARLAVFDEIVASAPSVNGREVLHDTYHPKRWTVAEVAEEVGPLLAEAQRRRELELATRARDLAASGGRGATGLEAVLAALAEGRVAHLLYDDARELAGYRSADGRLFARPEDAGAGAGELCAEPSLVERMVERAIETHALVTPLEGPAAEVLAPFEGVAAILRW